MIWQDYVFVIAMMLMMGTGTVTKYLISHVAQETGFGEVAKELESNPVARRQMDFRFLFTASQWLAVAFLTGVYWMLRRRLGRNEVDMYIISSYVIALVMLFAQNFLNDLPVLLGMLT